MKKQTQALKDLQDFEKIFWALSHATRRHILVVLNSRGGKVSAGDIAKRFSCSWPTTTRHLNVLLDAELVFTEKDGRENYYHIHKERLSKINEWLKWFKD
jgi:DNA-binding transcriptional ArsR family regulator